jgi:Ca2+/Na+ antiporter
MAQQGNLLASILQGAIAANPEVAAAQAAQQAEQAGLQVVQKHAGTAIMSLLVVLGIMIIFIAAIIVAATKSPHTMGYIFLSLGFLLAIGGGAAMFMLEKRK